MAAALFLIAGVCLLEAQTDLKTYKLESMETLRTVHARLLKTDSANDRAKDFQVSGGMLRYRLSVQYLDSIRVIRDEIEDICGYWADNVLQNETMREEYKHEILVRAGERAYWVPIKESVLGRFKIEMKKGSRTFVYMTLIGSHFDDLIFSIDDFRKAE